MLVGKAHHLQATNKGLVMALINDAIPNSHCTHLEDGPIPHVCSVIIHTSHIGLPTKGWIDEVGGVSIDLLAQQVA